MKPKVYVETSVISYLTSRPSRDLIVAAHQEITRDWWATQRGEFDLYVSDAVRQEATMDDSEAAIQRLVWVDSMPTLEIRSEALALSMALIKATALPAKAEVDALHIAIAAYEGMDFVLTWNFKHIANAQQASKVRQVCATFGVKCPQLCSPLELLGVN